MLATGYDHVDVKACAKRGIPSGHTPGAVNKATADVGMGLLLAAARNIVQGDRRSRQSLYDPNWLVMKREMIIICFIRTSSVRGRVGGGGGVGGDLHPK